jgi:hypothetical protein
MEMVKVMELYGTFMTKERENPLCSLCSISSIINNHIYVYDTQVYIGLQKDPEQEEQMEQWNGGQYET